MPTAGGKTEMSRAEKRAGLDFGASLVKIAREGRSGALDYELRPRAETEAVLARLIETGVTHAGVTGAGARQVCSTLATAGVDARPIDEFSAWGCGSREFLCEQGLGTVTDYLLVSIGTGTSVVRVGGHTTVTRAGGTALGGGTVLALARGLLGTADFTQVVALAAEGKREEVDLLLADIYPEGGVALPPQATASNLGKLASRLERGDPPAREHLARGLMGLVGENVGLICAGLARSEQLRELVFGGTTLRGNLPLRLILERVSRAFGLEPHFLVQGEFTGARGALELSRKPPSRAAPN